MNSIDELLVVKIGIIIRDLFWKDNGKIIGIQGRIK